MINYPEPSFEIVSLSEVPHKSKRPGTSKWMILKTIEVDKAIKFKLDSDKSSLRLSTNLRNWASYYKLG